jgi:hypothetical protein
LFLTQKVVIVQIAEAMLVGLHAELKFNFGVRTTFEDGRPATGGHVAVHVEAFV